VTIDMESMQAPRIVLGVTGSIAAYKAAELVRLMKKRGWDVSVVMTRSAAEFVGELTFRTLSQRDVAMDMFARTECRPDHLSLADRADAMVIAPCTANVLAKIAHGMADDLLSCTALACTAPLILAPAMNERMWDAAATQTNLATVRDRGATVLDVGSGFLACGDEGRGRMAEPGAIVDAVADALRRRGKVRA
jgi:phosphopantothenoylcysteine decarboxylase/phosphopantothenate--cysteine ligase